MERLDLARRSWSRRTAAVALALAALLGSPGPGTAAAPDWSARGLPIADLAAAVAAWVADELDAPAPSTRLRIEFTDADRMRRLRYAAEGGALPTLSIVALYDDEAGTIFLPQGWTGSTPAEMSILVHEMVHHLQNVSGRTFACPGAREAEALDLQERWLALSGVTLTEVFELNSLTLFVLTRCGR
jgi:hypothetical protein